MEHDQGADGPLADQAINAWNSGNLDRTADLWQRALSDGLTPTWECFAHESLGEIALTRGNLTTGVDLLVRCLQTRPITRTAAHGAAVRLQIINEAAGRMDERDRLAEVAARLPQACYSTSPTPRNCGS